jgi:hypothetical protein
MAGYSWSEYSELLLRAWLKDVRSPNCVTKFRFGQRMLAGQPKGPPKWVHITRENLAVRDTLQLTVPAEADGGLQLV